MQTFELRRYTDTEMVAKNVKDLEQLYNAIETEEVFIVQLENVARIVFGSILKQDIRTGKIIILSEIN